MWEPLLFAFVAGFIAALAITRHSPSFWLGIALFWAAASVISARPDTGADGRGRG